VEGTHVRVAVTVPLVVPSRRVLSWNPSPDPVAGHWRLPCWAVPSDPMVCQVVVPVLL